MWLFVGACFGLGYGVSQRLMRLPINAAWQGGQLFGVQPFPGTSLDSLRERFGKASMPVRGDLDLLEMERVKKLEAQELARRETELKRRQAEEEERRQREAERVRLEEIQRETAPAPEPPVLSPIESPLFSPPELPSDPPAPAPAPSP
jgi:hypothetical protein